MLYWVIGHFSDKTQIEVVWDYLDSQKQVRHPKSAEELWQALQYASNNLPADFLKLQDSGPKLIDAVLKVKGTHKKYWFELPTALNSKTFRKSTFHYFWKHIGFIDLKNIFFLHVPKTFAQYCIYIHNV